MHRVSVIEQLGTQLQTVQESLTAAYRNAEKDKPVDTSYIIADIARNFHQILDSPNELTVPLIKQHCLAGKVAAAAAVVLVEGYLQPHRLEELQDVHGDDFLYLFRSWQGYQEQRLIVSCQHSIVPVAYRLLYQAWQTDQYGALNPVLAVTMAQQCLRSGLLECLPESAQAMVHIITRRCNPRSSLEQGHSNSCSGAVSSSKCSTGSGDGDKQRTESGQQHANCSQEADTADCHQEVLAAASNLLQLCLAVCRMWPGSGAVLASKDAAPLADRTLQLAVAYAKQKDAPYRLEFLTQCLWLVQQFAGHLIAVPDSTARELEQDIRSLQEYQLLLVLLLQMQQQHATQLHGMHSTGPTAASAVRVAASEFQDATAGSSNNHPAATHVRDSSREGSILQQQVAQLCEQYDSLLLQALGLSASDCAELARLFKPQLQITPLDTVTAIAHASGKFRAWQYAEQEREQQAAQLFFLLPVVLLHTCSRSISGSSSAFSHDSDVQVALINAARGGTFWQKPLMGVTPPCAIILQQAVQLLQQTAAALKQCTATNQRSNRHSSSSSCSGGRYGSSSTEAPSVHQAGSQLRLICSLLDRVAHVAPRDKDASANHKAVWSEQWHIVVGITDMAVRTVAANLSTLSALPGRQRNMSVSKELDRIAFDLCWELKMGGEYDGHGGALLQAALKAVQPPTAAVPAPQLRLPTATAVANAEGSVAAGPAAAGASVVSQNGPQQLLSLYISICKLHAASNPSCITWFNIEASALRMGAACVQTAMQQPGQQQHLTGLAAAPWFHLVARTVLSRIPMLTRLLHVKPTGGGGDSERQSVVQIQELWSVLRLADNLTVAVQLLQQLGCGGTAAVDASSEAAAVGAAGSAEQYVAQQQSAPATAQVDCSSSAEEASNSSPAACSVTGAPCNNSSMNSGGSEWVGVYDWLASCRLLQLLVPHLTIAERLLHLSWSAADDYSAQQHGIEHHSKVDQEFVQAIKELDDSAALLAVQLCAARHSPVKMLDVLQQSSVVQQLPQMLQIAGEQLAALLPVQCCCNNPSCTTVIRSSELLLVGGKQCVCGGCKKARYCSTDCQHAAWSSHKPVCQRLKRLFDVQQRSKQ